MIEKKTIFEVLKTEVIPIKADAFLDVMEDILNGCVGQETVVKLLETIYKDEYNAIRTFASKEYSEEWDEEAFSLYQHLVKNRQVKFSESIEKKFQIKTWDEKEARLRDKAEKIKENYESCVTKTIKVDEIKIPRRKKEQFPNSRRIKDALDYYKSTNEFNNSIFLDQNDYLVSGFTIYYLCKMLNITEVMVFKRSSQEELVGKD